MRSAWQIHGRQTPEDEIASGLALQAQRREEDQLIFWCNERLRALNPDVEVYRKACPAESDWGGDAGIYLRYSATKMVVPGFERGMDVRRYASRLQHCTR